jgi:hypothetical protein
MELNLDSISVVAFLVSVGIPLLVGVVTKAEGTSDTVKSLTLTGFSILSGVGQEYIDTTNNGGSFDLGAAAGAAVVSFVIAVSAYYGVLKPTKFAGYVNANVGRKDKVALAA